MDELHNLSRALAYRSDEFKQCVKDLINEDHIFQWHLFSDEYKIIFK